MVSKLNTSIPAVAYARYSSANQNEASIEQQLRDIHRWAEDNGFSIIQEYKDFARSAYKEATEQQRPAFRQMIDDSKQKSFQAVIVWKTDRFSRNKMDSAVYQHKLRENGVRLYKVMETNIEGPEAVLIDGLMESMAQYYSENLSQNVKRGMNDSASKFKAMGRLPLGFVKDPDTGRYAIEENEAQIVRRIFEEYASGKAAVRIYEDLNAEGFRNKTGEPFNKSSIRKIIQNERYIGTYIFNGMKTENVIPAIIDRDLFDKAQTKKELHHHAPALKTETGFLLSGKLYCGECESAMPGDSGKSKTGKIYYWYTCRNKRFSHTCDNPRAIRDDLEERVITSLLDFLASGEAIDRAADEIIAYQKSDRSTASITAIQQSIKEAETKLSNILKAIESGSVIQSFIDRAAALEQEIKDLKMKLNQEKLQSPKLTKEEILFLFDRITHFDPDDYKAKQLLIETLLYRAYLFKNGDLILILNTGNNKDRDKITLQNIKQEIEPLDLQGKSSTFEPVSQPISAKSNFSGLIGSFVISGFYGMIFTQTSLR